MKPNTIQNTGIYKEQGIRNNRFTYRKNSDSVSLNKVIIINTDDGYAEIILPSDMPDDLISSLSEFHYDNLNDLSALINSYELFGKVDGSFNRIQKFYILYSTNSDGDKENIFNAGYITELPGIENNFYLRH